jgi:hypothetical protein
MFSSPGISHHDQTIGRGGRSNPPEVDYLTWTGVKLKPLQSRDGNSLHNYKASAETSTRDLPVVELRRTSLPLAFPLGFDEPLLWLCVLGAMAG